MYIYSLSLSFSLSLCLSVSLSLSLSFSLSLSLTLSLSFSPSPRHPEGSAKACIPSGCSFPSSIKSGRPYHTHWLLTSHHMSQNVMWVMFVCVKHLNRCKTCTLTFLSCKEGSGGHSWSHHSTKTLDTPSLLWYAIWTQIARTCTRYSNRLSSEPARRFVFPLHFWTVGAIWISTRITLGYFWWEAYVRMRVTNLDFILHYWRNSRLWFWSFRSICLFPPGYVDDGLPPLEFPTLWPDKCNENVFLHTRCVPHHNSIKQFEQICV